MAKKTTCKYCFWTTTPIPKPEDMMCSYDNAMTCGIAGDVSCPCVGDITSCNKLRKE